MQIYGCFDNKCDTEPRKYNKNRVTQRADNIISLKEVSGIMVSKIPLDLRKKVVLVKLEMRFAYESPYAAQVPEE